jgi:hypothetical protein
MAEFRFFGTETILPGNIALSKYGQIVEMEPDAANALIVASPPALLLPEELWESIGITEADLAEFPSATIHGSAPEEFRTKTDAARKAYHEYREGLLAAMVKAAKDGTLKVTFAEDRKAPQPVSHQPPI